MASTIRLSPDLQGRASEFAAEVGISLNALVAVALRDYIASRSGRAKPAERLAAVVAAAVAQEVIPALSRQQRRAAERKKAKAS